VLVVLPLRTSAAARATIAHLAASTARTPEERAVRGGLERRVAPARTEAPAVERWAAAHGLAVNSVGDFDVTLSGPVSAVGAAFGTHFRSATATSGRRRVAYLTPARAVGVPRAIAGQVSAVVGLDQRPVAMWANTYSPPTGGYSGADFHSAYDLPQTAAEGGGITVGTVQLSGWNQNDLDTFADDVGIPFLNQIDPIAVDGANIAHESAGGGNVEVDLDQETILADAPGATQRIYFTPLAHGPSGYYATDADVLAAYDALADDAAKGLVQVASTSWGGCEADISTGFAHQLNAVINRIVAAGATFFAATGDTGKYGCARDGVAAHRHLISVGFPASSPAAVAVGGTTLLENHHTHESYQERAWDDGSLATGGSNGGASTVFAKPAFQRQLPGTRRLVPDISADADERTPFVGVFDGGVQAVGGTSLAAPLSASMLADVEAAAGVTKGVGNILGALYRAPQSDFHDITAGGGHITFPARRGYDEVTGRGSPDWTRLAPRLGLTPRPGQSYHPLSYATVVSRGLGSGATTTVAVAGHHGVSAAASAAVLDVTVSGASASTQVSVYPNGTRDRGVNDADAAPGQARSTQLTVKLGAGGDIVLWNAHGSAHVDVVVEGYYSSAAGYRYHPLTPSAPISAGSVTAGDHATVTIPGAPGSSVALLDVSATDATGSATVSVSTGVSPGADDAVLEATAGHDAQNLVAVPVSSAGQITVTVAGATATVTADLEGYFTTGSGDLFYPQNPQLIVRRTLSTEASWVFSTAAYQLPMAALVLAIEGNQAPSITVVGFEPVGDVATLGPVLNLVAGETATNSTVLKTGFEEGFTILSTQAPAHVTITADGYFR
jgi:hypothetical protein